jgi:DNA invertase Pin-like site-specific DNA recombinase
VRGYSASATRRTPGSTLLRGSSCERALRRLLPGQQEGTDGPSSDPEEQEAAARAWAERAGVEVAEVVTEVVSGALAADDRELGRLIARCESGDLAGIVVRDEKRFARDVVAAGVALARLEACRARLVSTWTGFDTANLTPEGRMGFNILIAVGQAERERNLLRRTLGKKRAAERGVYAATPPVGYDRDDDGRLRPNQDADAVRRIFTERAAGAGFSEIARGLPEVTVTHTRKGGRVLTHLTRSGVRRVVMNRAYLGEQRIPALGRKGEPQVIERSHRPIVTEPDWEAANAIKGAAPVRRGLAEGTLLKGIALCGPCGKRLHVLAYGGGGAGKKRSLTYACTGCGAVALTVAKADSAVSDMLDSAILDRHPAVAAVIEGDTRRNDALDAVAEAQRVLAEYRDDMSLQAILGIKDWAEGLRVRKEAVEVARRALRDLPPPEAESQKMMTLEEYDRESAAMFRRRVIAEVTVWPRSAPHRLTLRWQGEEEPIPVPLVRALTHADTQTMAILANRVDPIEALKKLAAEGDQSAQEYLTAKNL